MVVPVVQRSLILPANTARSDDNSVKSSPGAADVNLRKIRRTFRRQWFGPLECSGWHLHGRSALDSLAHLQFPTPRDHRLWRRCSMTRHPLRAGLFVTRPSLLLAALCVVGGAAPVEAVEPKSIAWRDDYT